MPHLNIKNEGNNVGKEFSVRKTELEIESFSANCQKRIFLMGRGCVDPVELVGQRQQLELLEREVELPGVRNEVEEVWW